MSFNKALITFASGIVAFKGPRHRYYLTRQRSLLKLQMRRELMNQFLQTKNGMELLQIVDITEQGYGWYHVMSKDFSHLDFLECVRGKRDGLPLFLRLLNLWIQPPVDLSFNAQYNASNDPVIKVPVVKEPVRQATRQGTTICMPKNVASSDALQALVRKFK